MRAVKITVLALVPTFAVFFAAQADDTQPSGRVVELTVNESSSDDYAVFRGEVTVINDSNKQTVKYRWGGSSCPGKDLASESVDRLVDALADRGSLRIRPMTKPGQGGAKCIVGMQIVAKAKKDGDVPE